MSVSMDHTRRYICVCRIHVRKEIKWWLLRYLLNLYIKASVSDHKLRRYEKERK